MIGNEGVIAVEKVLALLDCSRPGNNSLTLTEPAQLSGYHKTTVHCLMNLLKRTNYIIRHDDDTHTPGHCLSYLGKLYKQSFELARIVQPELQALSQASSESASWYVIEGEQCLCLFRAEISQGLRHNNLPGSQFPLGGSAISKVLRYWGSSEPLQEDEPTLPFYISSARDLHTVVFAMPVFGAHGRLIMALAPAGPASRLTEDRKENGVSQLVQEAADRLSLKLDASKPFCKEFYGLKR